MNPKAKGSKFERDICKSLSLWISGGERQDCFWRSAMSGGRATVAFKNSAAQLRAQCGDICAVDPLGNVLTDKLYIECKHLKRLSFDSIIKGNRGQGSLLQIWIETMTQAERYSKIPVLICKQNLCPVLVCSQKDGVEYLCKHTSPILTAPTYGLSAVLLEDMLKARPPVR